MILSQRKVPSIKMAQKNLPRQRLTQRNWAQRMGKRLLVELVAVKLDAIKLGNVRLIPERVEKFAVKSRWPGLILAAALIVQFSAVPLLQAHGKDKGKISYGEALIVNVPFPEAQVEQVVQDVTQNGLIRGTKEYNKDQYISGAHPADSTHAFPDWTGPGKVFYKVRQQAIDPRNFKDSGDVGTVAVRYVLQPQGDKNTVLRIDAIFVEDFRKIVHLSDGSVEGSEYKDIRDRLDAIDLMQRQNVEAENEKCCRRSSFKRLMAAAPPPFQRRLLTHPRRLLPPCLLSQRLFLQHPLLQIRALRQSPPSPLPLNRNPVRHWSSMLRSCASRWSGW